MDRFSRTSISSILSFSMLNCVAKALSWVSEENALSCKDLLVSKVYLSGLDELSCNNKQK